MRFAVAITSLLALSCGSLLPHPTYSAQPTAALSFVPDPPPPARVETVPERPAPRAVWIDGEWVWRRRRWAWLPGRWVLPIANASYSPPVVVRALDGALYAAPGVWRNSDGNAIGPPPSLATATVDAASVVDASGEDVDVGPILREEVRPGDK